MPRRQGYCRPSLLRPACGPNEQDRVDQGNILGKRVSVIGILKQEVELRVLILLARGQGTPRLDVKLAKK
jgi:hypothetical protein